MAPFTRAYAILLLPVFLLSTVLIVTSGIEMGFLGYIAAAMVVNFIPSTIIVMLADKIGALAAMLYTGGETRTATETWAGLLDQARYLKSRHQYDEALEKIDAYLEHVPGYPEALFIKAQILWEGKKDAPAAKQCLFEVMKRTQQKDQWHQWARTMLGDMAR